jgi:hypothetical protein
VLIDVAELVGMKLKEAIALAEWADYEIWVLDQEHMPPVDPNYVMPPFQANKLTIRHLQGIVQKARIG